MARRIDLTTLISALAALDSVGAVAAHGGTSAKEWVFYVTFGAGTSAGTVVIETAPTAGYAGVWSNVATVNWAAASRTHHVAVTGVFAAVRARISVAIVGGTVDVQVVGAD